MLTRAAQNCGCLLAAVYRAATVREPAPQSLFRILFDWRDGTAWSRMDDVIPATPEQIRARFRSACANWRDIEELVDTLEQQEDVGALGGLAA